MSEIELIRDAAACKEGRTVYNIYCKGIKVGRWVNSKNGLVMVRFNGMSGTELDAGRLFADAGRARDYVQEIVINIKRSEL